MEVSGKRKDTQDDLASLGNVCEMCEVGNITVEANGFCKECEQNMCNSCFRQHIRATSCRHHTFLDINASAEGSARNNDSPIKCIHHEAELIKYYCRTHEAVGCGDCLVSKHSGCQTEFIKDLSDNFQRNEDYKTFMRNLDTLISERKEFQKKIQEKKKGNKVMLEKALKDIKQFRLDINKYLDKAETDITCQIQNVMEENETVLTTLENDCTMLSTKYEEITNMLNNKLYKNNVLFIHLVECKPKLLESEKSISNMKSKTIKSYEFECGQQLRRLISSSQKFGTLAISTSAVFPQSTDQARKKSISKECARAEGKRRHMREETGRGNVEGRYEENTSEREKDQTTRKTDYGLKSQVAVGARVKRNDYIWADWFGNGTVTAVHEDGTVTVKWDYGDSRKYRVGVGRSEVTLI